MSEKVTILPATREKIPVNTAEGTSTETFTVTNVSPLETIQSLSVFQGAIYASFVLTFCLAGFASVILYRKALKTKVFRFSMAAKVLALAFVGIALNNFFTTYLFNNYLNGSNINAPIVCGILIWVLVGPAIAIILNSLLTREDSPGKIKVVLDAFVYLIIFGCVVASMAPDLEKNKVLIFSFLGAFFFIIPIVRFLTALRMAKIRHPEVREVFIQILIYVLLFLPILLPALTITNAYGIIDSELKLFLINFIIFSFIFITGLLMIIAIDYVTQGINIEQPINVAARATNETTDAALSPPPPKSEDVPVAPVKQEEPKKPVEPIDEKPDSTVVEFSMPQHPSNKTVQNPEPQPADTDPTSSFAPDKPSDDSTQEDKEASDSKEPPKSQKPSKSLHAHIKAPNKPKKRF